MDAPKAPETLPTLSVAPAQFEIVIAENSGSPLSFLSPPILDISEMAELEKSSFSLGPKNATAHPFEGSARQRLADLQKKSSSFGDSATLHNRIANLQRALGDLQAEASSLAHAAAIDSRTFFRRKIAENFFRRGELSGAKEAFAELAGKDSRSALRIASLCVMDNDLDGAERWVTVAVDLTPEGYAERLFQGGIKLVKGEFEQAIRLFWMALNEQPASSVTYNNLALAYLGTNNPKKAFSCLKRAVALDPLNRTAILALADVGFLLDRDADVINSLRYFVEFEQREPAIWSRLARSLLRLDAIDECIAALKRQGAFERSASVWNNLGVAYAKKKSKQQSLEAFNYALSIVSRGGNTREEFMVARNIAQFVSSIGKPDLLFSITSSLVQGDKNLDLARDPQLCDIYGFHINALMNTGHREEALRLTEHLICDAAIGEALAKWLFHSITGLYGLNRNADESLSNILDRFFASNLAKLRDVGLMNNVAFALAEIGRLNEAEQCVKVVGYALHKDPYLTATFGLLNFRRGHRERGEALYKEAISLAKRQHDKTRIRQKMHLELARQYISTNPNEAKRSLEKVLKETHGEDVLSKQATSLMRKLT